MIAREAIILAAGIGSRLRAVVDDRPKGLIEIGGESLVGRSVRLLRAHGIARVTIVAGYLSSMYRAFAAGAPDVQVLINEDFASTGSMASLAIALDAVRDTDVLVLESDIVYEARALRLILTAADPDVTLVSGPTGAGDEVWVTAHEGALQHMTKSAGARAGAAGEFVGITRLSAAGAIAMRDVFSRFSREQGHGRMDYETGALVEVARTRPVAVLRVPDLQWGEIDNEQHHTRVVRDVWPRVQ
jgi:choline kinase